MRGSLHALSQPKIRQALEGGNMSFTVEVYWDDGLGKGPAVTQARFENITYPDPRKGAAPSFTPLTAFKVESLYGNKFQVDRANYYGDVRCIGRHPTTQQERAADFSANTGQGLSIAI
jgi:hypothetical protein